MCYQEIHFTGLSYKRASELIFIQLFTITLGESVLVFCTYYIDIDAFFRTLQEPVASTFFSLNYDS